MGLATLVRILALAYVGYVALLFVLQRSLLFPGTRLASPHALDSAPLGVGQVWLGTSFGRVEAWFFDGSNGAPTATLIFAHGNGELIDHWRLEMEDFTELGAMSSWSSSPDTDTPKANRQGPHYARPSHRPTTG